MTAQSQALIEDLNEANIQTSNELASTAPGYDLTATYRLLVFVGIKTSCLSETTAVAIEVQKHNEDQDPVKITVQELFEAVAQSQHCIGSTLQALRFSPKETHYLYTSSVPLLVTDEDHCNPFNGYRSLGSLVDALNDQQLFLNPAPPSLARELLTTMQEEREDKVLVYIMYIKVRCILTPSIPDQISPRMPTRTHLLLTSCLKKMRTMFKSFWTSNFLCIKNYLQLSNPDLLEQDSC